MKQLVMTFIFVFILSSHFSYGTEPTKRSRVAGRTITCHEIVKTEFYYTPDKKVKIPCGPRKNKIIREFLKKHTNDLQSRGIKVESTSVNNSPYHARSTPSMLSYSDSGDGHVVAWFDNDQSTQILGGGYKSRCENEVLYVDVKTY